MQAAGSVHTCPFNKTKITLLIAHTDFVSIICHYQISFYDFIAEGAVHLDELAKIVQDYCAAIIYRFGQISIVRVRVQKVMEGTQADIVAEGRIAQQVLTSSKGQKAHCEKKPYDLPIFVWPCSSEASHYKF